MAACESGGTGRRARLRGVWISPYGFKSRFSHHSGRRMPLAHKFKLRRTANEKSFSAQFQRKKSEISPRQYPALYADRPLVQLCGICDSLEYSGRFRGEHNAECNQAVCDPLLCVRHSRRGAPCRRLSGSKKQIKSVQSYAVLTRRCLKLSNFFFLQKYLWKKAFWHIGSRD